MAVAYKYYAQGTAGAALASTTVDLSSAVAGDYVLVVIARYGTNVSAPSAYPTGWSASNLLYTRYTTSYEAYFVYGKVLAAGENVSSTFTFGAGTYRTHSHAVVYSGVDQTTPVGESNSQYDGSAANTVLPASITSSDPFLVSIHIGYQANSTRTGTVNSGWYERVDYYSSASDLHTFVCDTDNTWGGGTSSSSQATLINTETLRWGVQLSLNAAPSATTNSTTIAGASGLIDTNSSTIGGDSDLIATSSATISGASTLSDTPVWSDWAEVATPLAHSESWEDTGVTDQRYYEYRIKATNETGESNWAYSNEVQYVVQVGTNSQTISGASKLIATVQQTISGASTLFKQVSATISGASVVYKQNSAPISGASTLRKTDTASITGASTLRKTSNATVSGASTLLKTEYQAIAGASTLLKQNSATIDGASTLQSQGAGTHSQNISGASTLRGTYSAQIVGGSTLRKTNVSSISGASKIYRQGSATISGASKLRATASATISGASVLRKTNSSTITGASLIVKVGQASISGASGLSYVGQYTIVGMSALAYAYAGIFVTTDPSVGSFTTENPHIGSESTGWTTEDPNKTNPFTT